ncbi:hypothetical protein [Planomonospora sphaerica]|nr:hypothetical protein [Planomonospora sphaerica]
MGEGVGVPPLVAGPGDRDVGAESAGGGWGPPVGPVPEGAGDGDG